MYNSRSFSERDIRDLSSKISSLIGEVEEIINLNTFQEKTNDGYIYKAIITYKNGNTN